MMVQNCLTDLRYSKTFEWPKLKKSPFPLWACLLNIGVFGPFPYHIIGDLSSV